ncbi:MAG: hypothetical protein IJ736_13650 [Firmicutes bacterium]|nr:hypothetical protein [Bacillota bacterium]
MNIRSENKNKQFSGFPKIVAIICIAIVAILAVGIINNRNKEQQRENAINEMQMEIDKDYDICSEILDAAKADEYTKGMIDVYKKNIENAQNPAEKFSIANSMLRFAASELNEYRTKIQNDPVQSSKISTNFSSKEKTLMDAQAKLIDAKNNIYDI